MEMNIMYWIQNLHTPVLDQIMVFIFNDIVGSKGEFWVILGTLLFLFPKTRKTGVCLLASYLLAYVLGDGLLKDLIARPRPCAVDESVALLVKRSTSYSCPSVHSMIAFASASAIFWYHKKLGIAALVFAALVALSRLYFFVHFPTDVLFGAALGFLIGTAVSLMMKKVGVRESGKK